MPRTTAISARRFQFVGGTSTKFWTIRLDGATIHISFGRIGTAGQSQTKTFADSAKAEKDVAAQISAKLRKGYQEVP